jgi:hypothetical protein
MSTPVTPNDRSGNDRSGINRPGNDRPGNDRPGNDRPATERTGTGRTGGDPVLNDPTRVRGTVNQPSVPDRRDVISRQKEQFGGMKFGCSFFGWLTATGTAVLLTGLLAAIGAALGLGRNVNPAAPPDQMQTAGLVGAIVAAAVVLIAYFCGGYVAARMARFNGLKQGIGVWLWALIAAAVVTVLALLLGNRFNMLSSLNGVIPIPVTKDALTMGGIITAVALIVVSLVGALLGGLAGMRFHRRVDRAGFEV